VDFPCTPTNRRDSETVAVYNYYYIDRDGGFVPIGEPTRVYGLLSYNSSAARPDAPIQNANRGVV